MTNNEGSANRQGFVTLTELIGDMIIPEKYRQGIVNIHRRASIGKVPYYSFGLSVYILALLSIILSAGMLMTPYFSNVPAYLKFIVFIVAIPIIFFLLTIPTISGYYFILKAKINSKISQMEEVFPDFLGELSLNLKAGQSLELALSNSTEKQYKALSEEMQLVCKKVELGGDLEVAMREFIDDYDSEVMRETLDLVLMGRRKGTKITRIVDRICSNLQLTRHLRKKVIASVANYRVFLSFVTVIIAPAMFALSYHLISLIRSITSQILSVSSNVILPISINAVRINDSDFILFSYLTLVLISTSTSVIISIIKVGTMEEGYKQTILLSGITIILFRFFLYIFGFFFQGFAI